MGIIIIRVHGTIEKRIIPATSHPILAPENHAIIENSDPSTERGACRADPPLKTDGNTVAPIFVPYPIIAGCPTRLMYKHAPANIPEHNMLMN